MKPSISSLVLAFALACALAFGLAACGAAQHDVETLDESIRGYNDGIRWQRYASAATRLPPKQRSQFADDMDQREKEIKITDYDVVRVDARGEREAHVQVKLSWYRESEGTLRETHAMQTWERQGKVWLMVDEARVRGAELPGLREPVVDPDSKEPPPSPDAAGTESLHP